ncbi:hypothetical protein RI367_001362 [Sorochytrium milnesiophthora]
MTSPQQGDAPQEAPTPVLQEYYCTVEHCDHVTTDWLELLGHERRVHSHVAHVPRGTSRRLVMVPEADSTPTAIDAGMSQDDGVQSGQDMFGSQAKELPITWSGPNARNDFGALPQEERETDDVHDGDETDTAPLADWDDFDQVRRLLHLGHTQHAPSREPEAEAESVSELVSSPLAMQSHRRDSASPVDEPDWQDNIVAIDLEQVPFSWIPAVDLLICRRCAHGVREDEVCSHVNSCGGERLVPDAIRVALDQHHLLRVPEAVVSARRADLYRPHTEAGPGIPQLERTEGVACPESICPYAATSSKTLKKHMQSVHPGALHPPGKRFPSCFVQRLYTHNGDSSYFCVAAPVPSDTPPSAQPTINYAVQSFLQDVGRSDTDARSLNALLGTLDGGQASNQELLDEYPNLPQSLYVADLDWRRYIDPLPATHIKQWVQLDRTDWSRSVRAGCRHLLQVLYRSLDQDTVRRAAFNISSATRANVPLAPPKSVMGQHMYADALAKAIVLLLQAFRGSPDESQNTRCMRRWKVPPDLLAGVGNLNRELAKAAVVQPSTLEPALLLVTRSLCMPAHQASGVEPWECALFRALVCMSVNSHGAIKRPSKVTSNIAALEHTIRVTAYHAYREATSMPSATATSSNDTGIQQLQSFVRWVQDDQKGDPTPFALLAQVRRTATRHAHAEHTEPRLYWPLDQPSVVYIDNVALRLESIKELVNYCVKTGRELYNNLCFGDPPDDIAEPEKSIADVLGVFTAGYSFLSDPRNEGLQERSTYLTRLLAQVDCDAARTMFCTVHGGLGGPDRTMFNARAAQAWLDSSQHLLELLCAACHLTSGQPPRAPEVASLLIRNTRDARRSVLWCQQALTLVTRYNKSQGTVGHETCIPRYPAPEVSKLLLDYLTVIRPFEVKVVDHFHGRARAQVQSTLLYCRDGQVWSDDHVRQVYRKVWLSKFPETGAVPFVTFGQFRQAFKGFCRKLMADLYRERSQYDDAFDYQGGHSSHTAEHHYGLSHQDLEGVTAHCFDVSRRISARWHSIVEHAPDDIPVEQMVAEVDATISTRDMNRILVARLQEQTRILSERMDRIVQPPVDKHQPKSLSSTTRISVQRHLTDMLQAGRLVLLRPGQYEAVSTALDRSHHQLVVLPTGGGKTAVALLPALMEQRQGLVTVVIVPLVALEQEWYGRAEMVNQGWSTRWPPHPETPSPVFVVSVERAATNLFYTQLQTLASSGRLARIVLDEAHLTVKHASFRQAMRAIQALQNVHVPLLLLTATVAPQDVPGLLDKCGTPDAHVHRVIGCTRPNQEFLVHHLPDMRSARAKVLALVQACMAKQSREQAWRGILYRQRTDDLAGLAKAINNSAGVKDLAGVYHGRMERGVKDRAREEWTEGVHNIMVCTDAFGAGIDCRFVRWTIHFGCPSSFEDIVQSAGRAGRDGRPCQNIVVTWQSQPWFEAENGRDRVAAVQEWGRTQTDCLRIALHRHLDGFGTTCGVMTDAKPCGNCSQRSAVSDVASSSTVVANIAKKKHGDSDNSLDDFIIDSPPPSRRDEPPPKKMRKKADTHDKIPQLVFDAMDSTVVVRKPSRSLIKVEPQQHAAPAREASEPMDDPISDVPSSPLPVGYMVRARLPSVHIDSDDNDNIEDDDNPLTEARRVAAGLGVARADRACGYCSMASPDCEALKLHKGSHQSAPSFGNRISTGQNTQFAELGGGQTDQDVMQRIRQSPSNNCLTVRVAIACAKHLGYL